MSPGCQIARFQPGNRFARLIAWLSIVKRFPTCGRVQIVLMKFFKHFRESVALGLGSDGVLSGEKRNEDEMEFGHKRSG